MENLFAILLLASLILLVIGFFSPKTSLFWDKKKEPTKKRSALIYGITMVASFILFGITSDGIESTNNSSSSSNNSNVIETKEDKKPALSQQQIDSIAQVEKLAKYEERKSQTIQAKALYNAYQANEVSADNNYKDKKFYVEGIVGDIGKDILDYIYVTLKTGDIIGSIQCYIDDSDVAANLQKGQRITVFGECDGLLMNVLMKDCKVVENLSDLK
jgi:hypothetical protein